MSGQTDDAKGRAKEAVGALTDNDKLRREGKSDQMAGAVKKKLEEATDWVEEKVDDVKDEVARRREHNAANQ